MRVSRIFLYDEPSVPQINLDGLANFLEDTFRVSTIKRKSIFDGMTNDTAAKLAASRIYNFRSPFEPHKPTEDEVRFEMRQAKNTGDGIVAYDGFEFQNIISQELASEETSMEDFHLVFTEKLTCTFDDSDYRYHGRALIGSNPSIISTTGILEAPAKPRQYYVDLMANYAQGMNLDAIKEKYKGTYLEEGDERLGKVIEGYAMQALFYYITGKPFCDLLDCRLNNAHWQRDLLYSQIEYGRLCPTHEQILNEWTALNNLNC